MKKQPQMGTDEHGCDFLEKLLDGAEVEWVALGKEGVGKFVRGGGLQKKDFTETGIGCIHYGQIYTHYGTYADETKTFVSAKFAKKARKAKSGTLIIATTSENDEDLCKAVAWLGDEDIVVSSDACFYTHTLNPKYVSYFFQTEQFHNQKRQYITGAKVKRVNADNLAKILIPIPCPANPEKSLAIQAEIVRILDTFTEITAELIAELTAELAARKKQYNYYRDQLLTFEEGEVEWKTMEEVGCFIRGKRFTKSDYTDNGIRVIHYGEIYTHYGTSTVEAISQVRSELAPTLKYAEPKDVVIAGVGETVEDVGKAVAWLGNEKVAIHDDSYAFRSSMNPVFISHYMQTTQFTTEKEKHVSRGKVKRLLINGISKMYIPIPFPNDPEKSLTEQARIVAILDKFDTLTHSISEGLPREIELRQKQYEYYRDLLLNFPKPEVSQ